MKTHVTLKEKYVGKHVRLLCDLKTAGGVEFKAGEVLYCSNIWNGRLNLSDPHNAQRGIRHVSRTNVVVIQENVAAKC